jgi:molybdopterin molybdotransferase
MTLAQRLPGSLTPLEVALADLLGGLEPVPAIELPLSEALGCIAAEFPSLKAYPSCNVAAADGWALNARDLTGASSYTPVPLRGRGHWVEAGDKLPDGCDCVIDLDSVDYSSSIFQVLTEAIPGQGVRRAGGHFADGFRLQSGSPVRPVDIVTAQVAGLKKVKVRRPKMHLINVPSIRGEIGTAQLIQESARCAGMEVVSTKASSRDRDSISEAVGDTACDLIVTIGGSGVGRTDATMIALAQCGDVVAHGIALRPGTTSAIAKIGNVPVVALSGLTEHALAAWWTLALPALDRLSGRQPRPATVLPLARKLASSVGIAEIALLGRKDDSWIPLALGDLTFETIVSANAWLTVPGNSEGFAAATPVAAYILQE